MHILNNIQSGTIKNAWPLINDTLSNGGVFPRLYLLDSKASLKLKKYLSKKLIKYHLIPPHIQHINAAERDITTWINRFYLD